MAKGKYEYWLTEDGLLLLSAWARDGLTDEQIAEKMGINVATLYRYKQTYCEICEAIKKGKEIVDIQVENALLKRALGGQYIESKTKKTSEGIEETIVIKEIPPDVGAAALWLKNRRPDKWRDRPNADNKEIMDKLDAVLGDIDVRADG